MSVSVNANKEGKLTLLQNPLNAAFIIRLQTESLINLAEQTFSDTMRKSSRLPRRTTPSNESKDVK